MDLHDRSGEGQEKSEHRLRCGSERDVRDRATYTDHGERGDEGKRRDGRRLVTSVLAPSQPRTITSEQLGKQQKQKQPPKKKKKKKKSKQKQQQNSNGQERSKNSK